MADDAQLGDTVRLTVIETGQVERSFDGRLYINRNEFYTNDRTVEILSRANQTLPSEPGTLWLDRGDEVWRVEHNGRLICLEADNPTPSIWAPFRRLVLK